IISWVISATLIFLGWVRNEPALATAAWGLASVGLVFSVWGMPAHSLRGRAQVQVEIQDAERMLSTTVRDQKRVAKETADAINVMANAQREMNENIKALSTSAGDSTDSTKELTSINEELGENMSTLAAGVRETVSS